MTRIARYAVEIWQWIAKGEIVFCFILVILAALSWVFALQTEPAIRWVGYVLQLFGMALAIQGLLNIRTYFRQPSLCSLLKSWRKQFPSWKKAQTISQDKMFINQPEFYPGWVDAWQSDKPDQILEDRIDAIVKNLDWVRLELGKLQNRLSDLSESHEQHKDHISEEIKNTKDEINSKLESLHTSDLLPSLVGLVWLTVGITLSTLPSELLELCKWLVRRMC